MNLDPANRGAAAPIVRSTKRLVRSIAVLLSFVVSYVCPHPFIFHLGAIFYFVPQGCRIATSTALGPTRGCSAKISSTGTRAAATNQRSRPNPTQSHRPTALSLPTTRKRTNFTAFIHEICGLLTSHVFPTVPPLFLFQILFPKQNHVSCFNNGHPSCCYSDPASCPSTQPPCEKTAPIGSYCTSTPDYT